MATPSMDRMACSDLLLERPNDLVGTITEKLLRFALGRSLEYYDMPQVRAIVRTCG